MIITMSEKSHPPIPPESLESLWLTLAQSELLSANQLSQLQSRAAKNPKLTPEKLLTELVRTQHLTLFQADRIARGQPQGLIVGPYRLLVPIARGGMGIVYLAQAQAKLVALKILPPSKAKQEPRMLMRFEREIAIGQRVPPHPHVTQTLAGGTHNELHYLAMEYVHGVTLKDAVETHGTLPIGEAAQLFVGLMHGLQAIHDSGVVHRDLKPGNIIVTLTGEAKILDFGLALILGELKPEDPAILGGPGYTLGTMDFLPPEQSVNAATVNPAADLYAMGCCLYFALTGEVPYPGGTAQEKVRKHRTETIPDIHFHNPTVPAEFARLVAWLMAKRPEQRPKSAQDFARHLEPWADPVGPATTPTPREAIIRELSARHEARKTDDDDVSETTPPEEAPQRNPRRWLLAIIGVILLVAFLLGFLAAQMG
jgi:eukaryotic-like serine/threonine-protein kinase